MDLVEFICEQVLTTDRSPVIDSQRLWLCCPYHGGGKERTPSFAINLNAKYRLGDGYCFACHIKKPYNDLALDLRIKPIKASSLVHDVTGNLDFGLKKVNRETPDLETLLDWPNQVWRTIPVATVKAFNGKLEYRHKELLLYLPVHIRKEYVGGIHCKVEITPEEKEAGVKAYLNTPGEWSHEALFGFDIARRQKGPVCIVEGARDTMKVHSLGGRAVGLIGSAVTLGKIRLLTALDTPYFIILTDPDPAGDKSADRLHEVLTVKYMNNVRIRLPDDKDPANLTPKTFNKVLEKAEEKLHVFDKGNVTRSKSDKNNRRNEEV